MHKPSHLREAFLDSLDPGTSAKEFTVEHDGEDRDLDWLLGQLWTCTDILPASYCDQLDMPKGSTYAQAVRRVKEQPVMKPTKVGGRGAVVLALLEMFSDEEIPDDFLCDGQTWAERAEAWVMHAIYELGHELEEFRDEKLEPK